MNQRLYYGRTSVKDIGEYNNGMTEYEFFSFLYDKVISKEIVTFSKLKEM